MKKSWTTKQLAHFWNRDYPYGNAPALWYSKEDDKIFRVGTINRVFYNRQDKEWQVGIAADAYGLTGVVPFKQCKKDLLRWGNP